LPIGEYIPQKLVNGRIGLVGDAAHLMTPLTAMGFNAALHDAASLADCVSNGVVGEQAAKALLAYESERLKTVRQLVQSGQSFSRSFGR
jgi:2-polyprenyl-6-methoxyphenol hydroxylase-like FAD-dependent oxidoreductase